MHAWKLDQAHSHLGFKVKHLMVSNVKGAFDMFEGTITAADDTFANAEISLSADIESINTNNAMRDGHLKSAEFFDAAQFPKLTFKSTSFTPKGGNEYDLAGMLTLKGVSKEVQLHVIFNGLTKDLGGKRVASFEVTGSLSREAFGVTWNAPIEAGGVAVGDKVVLDMLIEATEA